MTDKTIGQKRVSRLVIAPELWANLSADQKAQIATFQEKTAQLEDLLESIRMPRSSNEHSLSNEQHRYIESGLMKLEEALNCFLKANSI
jgi:hypothetical protein